MQLVLADALRTINQIMIKIAKASSLPLGEAPYKALCPVSQPRFSLAV